MFSRLLAAGFSSIVQIGPPPSGDTTGVTDSATLAAAVAQSGGKILQLWPGDYYLSATLSLGQAVELAGAGRGKTTIHRAAAFGNVIAASVDNVTCRDFSIDGGLSGFPVNANHGISAQNVNHFLAYRIDVSNYQNTAILIQGTPSNTYRNGVIEDCRCEGGGNANNGFLVVNMNESGIRQSSARGIRGGGGPGYGCQLKNDCRNCFIEDCNANDCTGGFAFGRDASPGVSSSRITGGNIFSCDVGIITGEARGNQVSGVDIDMNNLNVSDAVRLQTLSTNNGFSGLTIRNVGAARAAVRFDNDSADNQVTIDLLDAASAAIASFNDTCARNTVSVTKIGTNTPTNQETHASSGTGNGVRVGPAGDRYGNLLNVLGYIAETFQRVNASQGSQPTTQQPYYMPVYLYAGEKISNVVIHVNSFTGAPTNFFVGLYTKGGTQVAVSADAAGSIASTGQKVIALTTPYIVPNSDIYYVAILTNAGTFQLLRGAATTASRIGTNPFPYAQDSATGATLPTPATVAAGTIGFWAGVT